MNNQTLPKRIARTVTVLITLLLLIPATIIGWASVRQHDEDRCLLDTPDAPRVIHTRPVTLLDQRPTTGNYAIAVDSQETRAYVTWLETVTKIDIVPTPSGCTAGAHTNTDEYRYLYIHTSIAPDDTDGYLFDLQTTRPIPQEGDLFPPEDWLTHFNVLYIPALQAAKSPAWLLFTPLFSIVTITALVTMGILTYAQFKE